MSTKCSYCGTISLKSNGSCSKCGAPLPEEAPKPKPVVPPAPAPAAVETRAQPAPKKEFNAEEYYECGPAVLLLWLLTCFLAYLAVVYLWPVASIWAVDSWHFLWELLEPLTAAWWSAPWAFFQVLLIGVLGVLIFLAWLVTAIPAGVVVLLVMVALFPLWIMVFS